MRQHLRVVSWPSLWSFCILSEAGPYGSVAATLSVCHLLEWHCLCDSNSMPDKLEACSHPWQDRFLPLFPLLVLCVFCTCCLRSQAQRSKLPSDLDLFGMGICLRLLLTVRLCCHVELLSSSPVPPPFYSVCISFVICVRSEVLLFQCSSLCGARI